MIRHLVRGWGHFKKELGESVEILPASQRSSDNWYEGTADAVFQNIDIIRDEIPKYVMILSGDHIYSMDYANILAHHVESGAKMTVSCMPVPIEEAAGAFGVMSVDEDYRILGFEEKPEHPTPLPNDPTRCLASMGNYIFDTDSSISLYECTCTLEKHKLLRTVAPDIIQPPLTTESIAAPQRLYSSQTNLAGGSCS